MMSIRSFAVACGLMSASAMLAAPPALNFDLTVTHGVCSESDGEKSRQVVFLVVDRSGSMVKSPRSDGRLPNDVLIDSLKMQLASVPAGTETHVILFSSKVGAERVFKCLDDGVRNEIVDHVQKSKPDGCTVWYDAQDVALCHAAKIMDEDANAEVRVLVYSDGKHETPKNYEGEYKACTHRPRKGSALGRKGWEPNPNYQEELDAAESKFSRRFAGLIAKPNFELEREWVGDESRQPEGIPAKTVLPAELVADATGLRNPLERPDQTLKGKLHLRISDKCWEEIKGKPCTLNFNVGRESASMLINLAGGRQRCSLAWPLLPQDKAEIAAISFTGFPEGRKFQIKDSKPLTLNVPAQGRVAVSIAHPSPGEVVAFGREVRFEALPSEQADVSWRLSGAAEADLRGRSATWKADVPGVVSYRVTASKAGLKSAEASGSLEVIKTGVEVMMPDDRAEVGKALSFRARAVGPCLRYAWSVDKNLISGESSNVLTQTFKDPGEHQIAVTAYYKGDITADSQPKTFAVSKAPFVEILAPSAFDGDVETVAFQAEKPIDLAARVEGDLTEVIWRFKQKDKSIASFPTTVKGGRVVGRYTPPKGGYYDVVATGRGPAGEKSESIQIFVKSAEIRVDITNPKPNQSIETGREFTLDAEIRGPVKSVRWKMTDRTTAKTVVFGASDESAVIDGKATMTAKLPQELGNQSVTVEAEPVLLDSGLADTVVPSVIVIEAKTAAEIACTPVTLALNGKRVKYGEQVNLAVTTSGAINNESVEWVKVGTEGRNATLAKGLSVNVTQDLEKRRQQCPVTYRARGRMPDGNWKESSVVTIEWYCPHIEPKIVLPNNEADFAIDEEVLFKVISGNRERGELTDDDVEVIRWNFGDGTVVANNHVTMKHAFKKITDAVTVSVQTVCKRCGEEEPPSAAQVASIARPVFCSCVAAEIFMPGTNSVIYLGERTEFRLRNSRSKVELSDNDFKSVDWVIQDGSCETRERGADIGHEFSCMGKARISAKMVCKHCGRSSAALISRHGVNRPISASFGFNPDDNVFRPGTSVKLMDKSLGRVKGRKWFVDGVALSDDGKEVAHRLPGMPSEYSVNLAVCDSEGMDFLRGITNIVQLDEIAAKGYLDKDREELVRGVYYHSGHLREMKARWGGYAVLIILGVAALVWFGIWWVFHGNEPRGWNVQFTFCNQEDAFQSDAKRLDRIVKRGSFVDMKDTWSRLHKRALIRVRDVVAESGGKKLSSAWKNVAKECVLKFKQSSSAKQAYVEVESKYFKTPSRTFPNGLKGRAFLFQKNFGKKGNDGDVEYMFVFVDGVGPSVKTNFFLYIILPLLLLGLAYYLMTKVAF